MIASCRAAGGGGDPYSVSGARRAALRVVPLRVRPGSRAPLRSVRLAPAPCLGGSGRKRGRSLSIAARFSGMKTTKSRREFEKAKKLIPGGVNSPVRAFGSVGLTPRFIAKAKGARLWDVDGNEYIDYVGSWGPMILGHADAGILRAIRAEMKQGTSFGAPTEIETKLARLVCRRVPSIERVRMVSSGTEATMSALRLARGATGRPRILKFDGCYHGHADSLLVGCGQRRRDARDPGLAGRARGVHRAHDPGALQRPRRRDASLRAVGRRDRLRHRRAGGGQHGLRAAGPGLPRRPSRAVRPQRGAC